MSHSNTTHDDFTASTAPQRPRRSIKLSRRAEEAFEAGEGVPGLHSKEPRSPASDSNAQSETRKTFTNMATKEAKLAAFRAERKSIPRAGTAGFGGVRSSDIAPEKFAIYFWEVPRPKSFLDLSDSRKVWKRRTDEQEAATDIDDGSDDWHEFSGDSDQRVVARTFELASRGMSSKSRNAVSIAKIVRNLG